MHFNENNGTNSMVLRHKYVVPTDGNIFHQYKTHKKHVIISLFSECSPH